MRAGAVLLLILLVTGCGGQIPLVTPELVAAAQARWPTSSTASLTRGREVLTINCSRCHRAPIPSDHTEAEWTYYLREMGPRAQLQTEQADALQMFLFTARVPLAIDTAPRGTVPGLP